TGVQPSTPGEHTNSLDSGPAPVNAARFAFNYNSIELTDPVVVPPGGGGDTGGGSSGGGTGGSGSAGGTGGNGLPFTLAEFLGLVSEDKAQSDWQRENEGLFTGFNPYGMYFEGFD
ncbi:hypothetical protein VSU19_19460, partial [Verrucomicrobiales bacterium BCK34]|nr:hypothetical protein [Verrucomicrobiales bacterium BCK34]